VLERQSQQTHSGGTKAAERDRFMLAFGAEEAIAVQRGAGAAQAPGAVGAAGSLARGHFAKNGVFSKDNLAGLMMQQRW
jgi:hypothetical protein